MFRPPAPMPTRIRSNSLLGTGHTTASHTIGLGHLRGVLAQVPADGTFDDYEAAVVEENILSRDSMAGRRRVLRHLRELYALDPGYVPFRVLRKLWDEDTAAQPLEAGLLAFTRDELLRASWVALASAGIGTALNAPDLTRAVGTRFAQSLSTETLAKVGRNTASSWTQAGHLSGRIRKIRTRALARPANVTFALALGYLADVRGALLFDTPWTELLDAPRPEIEILAGDAARLGHLDLRAAGGVVDISFPHLLGDSVRAAGAHLR